MCSYILNRLSSKQNIFSKKLYKRLKKISQKRIYARAEPIHIKCIKISERQTRIRNAEYISQKMRTHPKDSFQRPRACSTSHGEKKSSTRPENRVDAARYDDSQL